jgi:hypothetical protein
MRERWRRRCGASVDCSLPDYHSRRRSRRVEPAGEHMPWQVTGSEQCAWLGGSGCPHPGLWHRAIVIGWAGRHAIPKTKPRILLLYADSERGSRLEWSLHLQWALEQSSTAGEETQTPCPWLGPTQRSAARGCTGQRPTMLWMHAGGWDGELEMDAGGDLCSRP